MNNTQETRKMTKTKKPFKTVDLVLTAMGAVLITVCSWISIPTTVPFTMQTFAIFFVLSMLGGKRGTAAILVYILLGGAGVPVFAEFTSGIGILFGTTGGYMLGFLFIGLLYWLATGIFGKKLWVEILAMTLGIIVMYAFGTAWFMVIYAKTVEAIGIGAALSFCVLPFVIPDIAKLGLALLLVKRIPAIRKIKG